ncbi:c-type cytochrome [Cognatishimia sp. MH4019]|uniref:c-type cytochrome n=1 Tax=Cognatishimia sp. MH4019 TaxID=2854030 RepID=UPI001CD79F90|nr:c-type cytochrome [Cognatishimia sp. MH4019]
MRLLAFALACLPSFGMADGFFTLKGHGGPVMGVAVSPTGQIATASFDNTVGLWDGTTPVWLEGHEAAVKAVRFVDDTRLVSAGDDFRVLLWDDGVARELGAHQGKVMALAVSGTRVASASWDGTIGLWSLGGADPIFLEGHTAGVNDVAFSADGTLLYSASTDGTLRVWDVATGEAKRLLLRHGFGINQLVLNEAEGWLAYGAVDGVTRVLDLATDAQVADFTLDRRPVLAMAANPEMSRIAVGDGEGFIMVIDSVEWRIARDYRATAQGPVWALSFSADGANIHAGGLDDAMYSWPLETLTEHGQMTTETREFLKDPDEMSNGERQFARKCSICHTLTPGSARRAGPTLYKVFGRPAGTVADYSYSDTLTGSDIIWDEDSINALFDLGPDHYIPGSKMPMQRITAEQDRKDLITYLRGATAGGEDRP